MLQLGLGYGFTSAQARFYDPALDLVPENPNGLMVFDPSLLNSLFQNSDGSNPVTALGQPVGRMKDLGKGNQHALQASADMRPLYARAPQGGVRNMLPNSSTIGLVAGVVGSGGAFPAQMNGSATLTRQVIGEGVTNGIPWTEIRFTGNLTGSYFLNFSQSAGVTALAGQTWITSTYLQVVGQPVGVSGIVCRSAARLAGGIAKYDAAEVNIGFPTEFTRFATAAATLSDALGSAGPVAFLLSHIRLGCVGAVDITIRIGGYQAEQSNVLTPFQLVKNNPADVEETGKGQRFVLLNDLVNDALSITIPPSIPVGGRRNLLSSTNNLALWTTQGTPDVTPDGTLGGEPAFRLTDNDTNAWEAIALALTGSITTPGAYTFSVRVKKELASITSAASARLNINTGGSTAWVGFRLNTTTGVGETGAWNYGGAVVTVQNMQTYWQVSVTFSLSAGHAIASATLFPAHHNPDFSSSLASNVGSNTWAAPQLEAGNVRTNYQRVISDNNVVETARHTIAYATDSGVLFLNSQTVAGAYTLPGPRRLYGMVIIDRPLTAAEVVQVTTWLNEKR